MKRIIWTALATLALAACTNDDITPAQTDSKAISFSSDVTAASRATVVTDDNLESFWVRAVNTSTSENLWTTTGGLLQFDRNGTSYEAANPGDNSINWPDYSLTFYATNLDPNANVYTAGTTNPLQYTITPALNVNDQIDFVYAANMGSRDDFGIAKPMVPLQFKHALCQIEIQAKCSSTEYTVKVKGYLINYQCNSGTFTLVAPTATYTDPTSTSATPAGSWTWRAVTQSSTGADETQYVSGFYGGYNTNATSIHDNSGDYIQLTAEPQVIHGGDVNKSRAMLVPHGAFSGYHSGNNRYYTKGFYIALLVQIDNIDASNTPIYPAYERGSVTRRISYAGLPKYYGYIYTPITINWNSYAGKKLTYVFDLSEGLGQVDPRKPDTVNADTYNPEDGTGGDGGGTDPYTSEATVLGSNMTFSTSVGAWSNTDPEYTPVPFEKTTN